MTAAAEQIVYIASFKIDEFQQNFNQFTFCRIIKIHQKIIYFIQGRTSINETIEIFPLNQSNFLDTGPSVDEFLNLFLCMAGGVDAVVVVLLAPAPLRAGLLH
jgi:hypothetical protein